MKILAVDDDETILELLTAVLNSSGYTEVTSKTSGREALKSLATEEQPFDCVLSDIQMPEMDGIELCSKIRRTPGYDSVPIIMVTAMSDRSYVDRAFESGATDFVTKPFDILELTTRVNLAAKLVYEHKLVAESISAYSALKEKVVGPRIKNFADPIEVLEGDRVLGSLAFENYLTQLTRLSLFQSSLFAIKVVGLEQLFSSKTGPEFQRVITRAAQAISSNLKTEFSFLAYRGNGVFVCIDHNNGGHDHSLCQEHFLDPEIRDAISMKFRLPQDLNFVIGEAVPLSAFIKSGNIKYLQKAVDLVEAKHFYVLGKHTREYRPKAVNESLQQPYKSLLQDCLEDGLLPTAN